MTRHARVGIVGAGLSGLWAATLLAQRGMNDVMLFEARKRLGGRVCSAADLSAAEGALYDLGAAWFWPELQPELAQAIEQLGLPTVAQHEVGDTLWERTTHAPPWRLPVGPSAPPARRLAGGMASLVHALQARLPPNGFMQEHRVCRLALHEPGGPVTMHTETPDGATHAWNLDAALLALPPRLAAQLAFEPPLPPALRERWHNTPTWMAPHAKYLAVYERPFWRGEGLSGSARSATGPLGEVHDASSETVSGAGALFGFLSLSAAGRRLAGEAAVRSACRAQLARLFGPEAARPQAEFFQDWANERFTATEADVQQYADIHRPPPPAQADVGPWQARIVGIGSEWSPQFPGYLAGALDAAQRGVTAWVGRA